MWTAIGLMLLTAGAALLWAGRECLRVASAYKARLLCSAIFLSNRQLQNVEASDLGVEDLAALTYLSARVDQAAHTVTVSLWGCAARRAIYRDGTGSTLLYDGIPDRGRLTSSPVADLASSQDAAPWPKGDQVDLDSLPAGIHPTRLREAMQWAFAEPYTSPQRRTRAVVIAYQGQIVAERYAPGFGPDTPLLGWSMTKSVINALTGIMVKKGRWSLDEAVQVPEWQRPDDARQFITLDHLLRMTSGLQFTEDYRNPFRDVITMLLRVPDAATYAIDKPLHTKPGSAWHYSSGNTNIIARLLRDSCRQIDDCLRFPRQALFDRIGMRSAVIEADSSGTFVGSSFMYATARDWARFGQLYIQDGVWEGERILPEGWVDYSMTPTPQAPNQEYGAHFWLRVPHEFRSDTASAMIPVPGLHAAGYEGQFVSIVPARDLVVVRLGLARFSDIWDQELFLHHVLQAIKQ